MYIISGRGRKSGVARATGATASLAPMYIHLSAAAPYILAILKKTIFSLNKDPSKDIQA